jgi:predicted DCC family thiol-disulfide oxidoreductase YuxK
VGAHDRVVLFDGVCNLCSASVQFLLAHDPAGKLRFASLQSDAGRAILAWAGLPVAQYETIVFIEEGRVYLKSTAVLRLARHLSLPWCWLTAALIVPAFLRDWFYDRVALNRYLLFGRRESCLIPTPEIRRRFL